MFGVRAVKGGRKLDLREERRDLFSVGTDYSLAHCISKDCAMGAGIASHFEKRFKMRKDLLDKSLEVGKAIIIERDYRVFNLITKQYYWNKPTYEDLEKSLKSMKSLILGRDIDKIAMPRIGCGLDGLRWILVFPMIRDVFKDIDVEILICYL